MAKLINDITDLKKHITVNAAFDFNLVFPYTKRAERKYIETQIGYTQLQTIIGHTLLEDSNLPIDRVKLLLQEATANYALFLALPFISIQITNMGTRETITSKSEPADWKKERDLKRTLIATANEALDDALEIMEDFPAFFLDWSESSLFTLFNSLIVSQTKTFQSSWDIQKNRKTFLALQPHMVEVEEQYLLPMLGQCTLDFIKLASANQYVLRAQDLAQKAVVALTVAKVALTGTFLLTSSSLVVMNEELPWEKTSLELSPEKLEKLNADRQKSGEEYLKKLKKVIVDNPTIFTCYEDKTQSGLSKKIIVKKSHLML